MRPHEDAWRVRVTSRDVGAAAEAWWLARASGASRERLVELWEDLLRLRRAQAAQRAEVGADVQADVQADVHRGSHAFGWATGRTTAWVPGRATDRVMNQVTGRVGPWGTGPAGPAPDGVVPRQR